MRHDASGWNVRSITSTKAADRLYGMGGASFESEGAGARAVFATARQGAGDRVGRFDLFYLERPGGGDLELFVDGQRMQRLATAGPEPKPTRFRLEVDEGPHTLMIRVARGEVRGFGVALERRSGGVAYASLGLVSNAGPALNLIEPRHWAEELRRRGIDLGLFLFGTNEANYTGVSARARAEYQQSFARMLASFKAARPDISCLVMAPLDTATLVNDQLQTKPPLPGIVEAQRRAALLQGCAFWDTFTWMGGKGSMIRWHQRGLAASDYTHPTRALGSRIADALFEALASGHRAFRAGGRRAGEDASGAADPVGAAHTAVAQP